MKRSSLWISLLLLIPCTLFADTPWFTGPILANSGLNTPKNRLKVKLFQFEMISAADYSQPVSPTRTVSAITRPILVLGLSDTVDILATGTLNKNTRLQVRETSVGDTNLGFGFQVLQQDNHRQLPNTRLILQETIPTDRYNNFNALANGTNSTGLGSYQTNIGLCLDAITEPFKGHFLETTLNLNFIYVQPTTLYRLTTYEGFNITHSRVNPGNLIAFDFAAELTLHDRWVGVIETYLSHRDIPHVFASRAFQSENQPTPLPTLFDLHAADEVTIAPAIEYNYTQDLGIIGGVWLSLGAQHSPRFNASTIGLRYLC